MNQKSKKWMHKGLAAGGLASVALCVAMSGTMLAAAPGCQIIGALAGSFEATGSHDVEAEYTGLEGKSFVVVVKAGQLIQADYPEVVIRLTNDISARLAQFSNASGFVPGPAVVEYLYNHPRWVAQPLDEVAKQFGVQRVVYVELTEYRLQDPGNAYIWQGVGGALVAVVEADGVTPEEFIYRKQIRITYPDKPNYGPNDLPRAAVNTEMTRRLVDRASWLFYKHEEKNRADY